MAEHIFGDRVIWQRKEGGITFETVKMNAEQRERIVRCRDCRRSFEERGDLWCRGIVGPPIEPEGFCAWGEPREEE